MEPRWKSMSPYELLEVNPKASIEEIKYAWQLQKLAWHPDKFPDSFKPEVTERFQNIKNAYDILCDPVLRKRLDLSLGIFYEDNESPMFEFQFKLPEQRVAENWKRLAHWAKEEDKLSAKSRSFAYEIADQYLEKGRRLSDSQLEWANSIWEQAIQEGFDPGDDE